MISTDDIQDGSVTAPKLYAQVANRLVEFDIRDSQFGGKWNDIDDDTPAIAAFINYCQTLGGLTKYQGQNAARLHLPRGVGRISDADVTQASCVHIVGEGNGITIVRNPGNKSTFKSTNVSGVNDALKTGFADFTIYGPGRSNVNAHGFDLGALNNGFIRDVGIYACRDAVRLRNNWQTDITRIKIDGGSLGGGLTCYRGLCLLDGPGSVLENAVKVFGGIISGCEMYGVRGESVTGSAFFGLEVLGAGNIGVYLGDNPSGKDLKWFTWSGGLIDTCGDLLVVSKGSSGYAGQMHLSGLWMGYANAGGGQGDAIRLSGIQHSTFRPDVIFNSDTALVAVNCDQIAFDAGVVQGYDRSLVGAVPIQLINTSRSNIKTGRMTKTAGSPSTLVLAEVWSSDYNVISGINSDGSMTIVGQNTIVTGCRPFKTKATGTVVIPKNKNSITVYHQLGRQPFDGEITVNPLCNLKSVGVSSWWMDTITDPYTFTIHTDVAPASPVTFSFQADVSRG